MCSLPSVTHLRPSGVHGLFQVAAIETAVSKRHHTFLEEDPVAYIVVCPDYQEDEVTLQEPLKILRLPIVLAMEASERLNTQDSTSWTSDNSGRNKVWNFSGSVFMIIRRC